MYSDRATDNTGTGETSTRPTAPTGETRPPADVDTVRRQEGDEVADLVNHARSRSDGFRYGDDRAIGDRPNWAAHDSKQLYAFATVNNDPGSAETIGHAWKRHGGELTRVADDLYNAISELGSVWIGQGAGAAQGALVGIANSGAQASEAAKTMQDRMARQAAAAAQLKSMPQPKDFDPAAETAAMLGGGPAAMVSDLKEKFDAAQETKAQQVAFLDAYTAALSDVDNTTPSFGPESLGLKSLDGGVNADAGRLGAVGSYAMPGGDVVNTGPSGVGAGSGIGGHGADQIVAGGNDGGTARPPAPAAGAVSASGPTPAQAATPPSSGGPGVGAALGAAVGGGVLGAAGAKALSSGKRSGSKRQSSEETDEAPDEATEETVVSSDQQAGTSMPAQNQSTLSSAGTIGAAQSSSTPGAAGSPMGMGGMGAGGGGQDGEQEHTHASFLIEPDPDSTFGATESAAPPVLGAWGLDDEER